MVGKLQFVTAESCVVRGGGSRPRCHAFVQSEHEDVLNRAITTSLPTATEINCRGRAKLFSRMDVYRVYWLAGNARSETRIAHRVIGQFYFEFLRTGTGTGMNEP